MSEFPTATWLDPGHDVEVDDAGGWECQHGAPAGSRYLQTDELTYVRCPDCGILWVVYLDLPQYRRYARPIVIGPLSG